MKWIIRAYALGLLAYTGFRTYDFISSQLPSTTSGNFIALLFLLATEIGLLLWHEVSMNHTTTETQELTATALTWIDFAAATGAGIADMILRQTVADDFVIPPLLVLVLIYGLPIVVALNVAGVLFFLSTDSEVLLNKAKKKLTYEIHKQTLKDLTDSRGAVAASLKKTIATELREEVTGNAVRSYVRKLDRLEQKGGNHNQEVNVLNPTNGAKPAPKKASLKEPKN